MSKKRFSTGLDELLQQPGDTSAAALSAAQEAARDRRSGAHKNFTDNLVALFEEAFGTADEAYQNQGASADTSAQEPAVAERGAGLDALIRPTQTFSSAEGGPPLKRLTLILEATTVEKLRRLARIENLYMKDLLQRAIDEYLEKHLR